MDSSLVNIREFLKDNPEQIQGFINTMELALDWGMKVPREHFEVYKELIKKERQ